MAESALKTAKRDAGPPRKRGARPVGSRSRAPCRARNKCVVKTAAQGATTIMSLRSSSLWRDSLCRIALKMTLSIITTRKGRTSDRSRCHQFPNHPLCYVPGSGKISRRPRQGNQGIICPSIPQFRSRHTVKSEQFSVFWNRMTHLRKWRAYSDTSLEASGKRSISSETAVLSALSVTLAALA